MLLNFDESGAEWIVVAYLSRDENMLRVVREKKSPHTVTGAIMSGLPEDIVIRENKLIEELKNPADILSVRKAQIPEVFEAHFLPRTMSIRQAGKKANHSCDYCVTAHTMSIEQQIDLQDAKKIVDSYTCRSPNHGQLGHSCGNVVYPGIRDWWDRTDAQLDKTRTLTNCFGRKCYFMGQLNHDMHKQGYAFVPSSTVVDVASKAMVRYMEDESPEFQHAYLLAQVHDSLLFDYVSLDFMEMAQFSIQIAFNYMRPIIDYGEPFQLDISMKVGMSWGDMIEIKPVNDINAMAIKLEDAYKALLSK